MKKFFLNLAIALLPLASVAQTHGVYGDVNGDGVVDGNDLNDVINIVLGKLVPASTPTHLVNGDVNGDGVVDGIDINELINIILDKTETSSMQTFTVNGVSFTMVDVEGGTFTMGATAEQGSDAEINESPAHQVTLSSFSIGQTEVTQELWLTVMGSNPSWFKDDIQRPVEFVNWDECQEFITKLNEITGKSFRLPTEAEWEYAARGGNKSQGFKYSGSNNIDEVAWYSENSGSKTHAVGIKAPNELGLYDMSGNVYEWCQDWYGDYSADAQTNPTGAASGNYRVGRSGSWGSGTGYCRVSARSDLAPTGASARVGLRLAL
jgi:formylglycine-generating enzyme required for sulfatase activity